MDNEKRKSDHPVNPLILMRWSPRSFTSAPVPEEKLNSILEAARWAPSCFNEQPWKWIVARTEADRQRVLEVLAETNRVWADKAPVLLVLVSHTVFSRNGKPNRWNGFDAGCAWGYLALEAVRQGLYAHAMGGFDKAKARAVLNIPEDYEIYAVIAMGEQGPEENLPEELQERELPSDRKALSDMVCEGLYRETGL